MRLRLLGVHQPALFLFGLRLLLQVRICRLIGGPSLLFLRHVHEGRLFIRDESERRIEQGARGRAAVGRTGQEGTVLLEARLGEGSVDLLELRDEEGWWW